MAHVRAPQQGSGDSRAPHAAFSMSKNIFLSYAGRTVKAPFDGSSKEDLASCFSSQFPHSSSQFVYYIADPATGVQYEVSDVADITDGAQVVVKLCDESGGTRLLLRHPALPSRAQRAAVQRLVHTVLVPTPNAHAQSGVRSDLHEPGRGSQRDQHCRYRYCETPLSRPRPITPHAPFIRPICPRHMRLTHCGCGAFSVCRGTTPETSSSVS